MSANTKCLHCRRSTEITPGNAVIHLYTFQPWFSWLQVICTQCGMTGNMFFGPTEWEDELKQLGQLGVGYISDPYAPEDMIESFSEIYELSMLKEKDLTPRQEAHIAFFAWLLDRGEMPWST